MRIVTRPYELTVEESLSLRDPLITDEMSRSRRTGLKSVALCGLLVVILELIAYFSPDLGAWLSWVRVALWFLFAVSLLLTAVYFYPKMFLRASAVEKGDVPTGDMAIVTIDETEWRTSYLSGVEIVTPIEMLYRLKGDAPSVVVLGNGKLLTSIPERAFSSPEDWHAYQELVSAMPVSSKLTNPKKLEVIPPKLTD